MRARPCLCVNYSRTWGEDLVAVNSTQASPSGRLPVVMLLLIHCLLLLFVVALIFCVGYVFGHCFVMLNLMYFLMLHLS